MNEVTNEYSQMVTELVKPGQDIIDSLTPDNMHLLHMTIGLVGEVAEFKELELYAKANIEFSGATAIEELGDIEFYFESICQMFPLTTGVIVENESIMASPIDSLVVVAGEILDHVKKLVIYNREISVADFIGRLLAFGGVLKRLQLQYGITKEQAQAHNMDKLLKGKKARYKEGKYSDEAAQTRADKKPAAPKKKATKKKVAKKSS